MKNPELKAQIYRKFSTLTDFSRVIGITDNQLSRIIHGRSQPTDAERETISRKLGVPPQEIFSQD